MLLDCFAFHLLKAYTGIHTLSTRGFRRHLAWGQTQQHKNAWEKLKS